MRSWPVEAVAALALTTLHAFSLALVGIGPAGSLTSELLQLFSVGLAAFACLKAGRRLPRRPGRFGLLLGLGFTCWFVGQVLILRYVNVLQVQVPAIAPADVPFLAFYLPAFAALFPDSEDVPGVRWARTLDLAQVGIVLGGVYLYFFFALNLGVDRRVITLHFGFLDSYSLLNVLLVGSYAYAWWSSHGEARALYGRMAVIFALYSLGDTFNTYRVIEGEAASGDWLDLSYSLPFALATVTASRWPAHWAEQADSGADSAPWRLFPLLPPALVLVVAGSVARQDLTLATILVAGSSLCFGARLAVTQAEQRQALKRLRRSEAEYRSLVENAPYGIFRYSPPEDRFASVNQALVDMLGHGDRDAVLALRPRVDVFAEPGGLERLLESAGDGEPPTGVEVEWKRGDGTRLTVRLRTQRPGEAPGAGLGLEVSAEDITHSRKLEDQLRQAVKMEAVGRLAGGVAHDFNNLLMVVTGAAELLRRRLAEGDPQLPHVQMIQKAAQDATDLTRQLLAFSRRQSLEPKVLDLNQVLSGMAEMLPRLIEESIEQHIRLAPGLGRVKADPGQMRQVVLNLAVNARDAMPNGGDLIIETKNASLDGHYV
ncbi:MAG TPA: histidine kinase dimerization/phospho-acceptor domain-containing protein, partial [Vicinamibacteria bacterium]